ncbi:hypothetical protein [Halothiobacillus diazotrophicus]|nr:hypothetical protein [Halothiobacillus diazotrophicus]
MAATSASVDVRAGAGFGNGLPRVGKRYGINGDVLKFVTDKPWFCAPG